MQSLNFPDSSKMYNLLNPQTNMFSLGKPEPQSKPVFVIATSETCPHCVTFKSKTLPTLKQKLITENIVRIVEINLPSSTTPVGPEYPAGLQNLISWFPTFILVSANSWDDPGNKPLTASVFNGQILNGKVEYVGGKPISDENIVSWIKSELINNTLLKNGASPQLTAPTVISSNLFDGLQKNNGIVNVGNQKYVPTIGKQFKFKPRTFDS